VLKGNNTSLDDNIRNFVTLYNEAEKVYKSVQQIVLRIDAQIHNEFRYCARGLADFLEHLTSNGDSDHDKAISLLNKADHAARNALNDSIDLLVAYAKTEIQKLAAIDTGRSISSYYTDFGDVKAAILSIGNKTEQTRKNRCSRLAEYIEISNSDDFVILKKFCQYLPFLENEIGVEYGKRVAEGRRFWVTVCLALISIVVGLPSFYQWANKNMPTELSASVLSNEKDTNAARQESSSLQMR
jgi:hypothetical protein